MNRVKELLCAAEEERRGGRGPRNHRRRRMAERSVRRSAVVFLRWVRGHGLSCAQAAERLGVSACTLREWRERWREDHLALRDRGRPVEQLDGWLRGAILSLFDLMGPQVGLPTLQGLFPDVPRAALEDLQRRYRRVFRWKNGYVVHALRWTRPGTVWATDFTTPPKSIEGLWERVILVRDLASGRTLSALPSPGEPAWVVVQVLEGLFRCFGAPLVLKLDNGGAFRSEEVKACLRRWGVWPLYSPEGTPSYNGSIEAGIGSIAVRAHYQSARHDRPGEWTCDDVEAAMMQANETGRPNGAWEPTPDDSWRARLPITADEREAFDQICRNRVEEEYTRQGILPMGDLQHREQASVDRVAISRALIDGGFLLIRRRRIPPPISIFRSRKIS